MFLFKHMHDNSHDIYGIAAFSVSVVKFAISYLAKHCLWLKYSLLIKIYEASFLFSNLPKSILFA